MINLVEAVRANPKINQFEIGDFLFSRFTCGIIQDRASLWAPQDYIVHVLTGKKTWHTADGVFTARRGETLFFKKGAAIVEQHLEMDFCLLMFFIPDDLIRSTVREIAGSLEANTADSPALPSAVRIVNDTALSAFFDSMSTYFAGQEPPSEPLLRVKLKELAISILTSGQNPALANYFRSLGDSNMPSVAAIMETNYRFNLSLEEYARLCHRSLSSFKREFQIHFQTSPGKWLLGKRLDFAAALLRSSQRNVTEIAFDSGFEDVSHFSRAFKARFGVPPMDFRQALPVAA